MEKRQQPVGHSLGTPDDVHVQVNGDGHGPEERAAVGERGHGSLDDAVQRVVAKHPPDAVAVGDGGEPVRHRQEQQEHARGGPQVGPGEVGEYDERGAHERQGARAQHHHLLGQVNHRLVAARHGLVCFVSRQGAGVIAVKTARECDPELGRRCFDHSLSTVAAG